MKSLTRRRVPLLLVLLMFGALLPQVARAAIIGVDCNSSFDDITEVQDAVDSSVAGGTVRLSGICDFTLASPHFSDQVSIENTAILVGAGGPINGLTIDSASAQATVLGNGLNAAITIAPNAANVTVKGLRFLNNARSVVAVNTTGTTVGAAGATPNPAANRIIGSATMDQAIMGLAIARNPETALYGNIVINYGVDGGNTQTFGGQASASLVGFTVAGNYITYAPTGTDLLGTDVVAIDVRQRHELVARDIDIVNNSVGFLSPVFPTPNYNGISLHSYTPNANPLTNTAADYFIRDVRIQGNNLGRSLEELGPIADINAAGRTGISMTGVGDFDVSGNGVRAARTPTVLPMPGGGIVVSDSGFGRIANNGINVLSTFEGESSDFGAIGIVDDLSTVYGGVRKRQPTRNIIVENNVVGTNDPNTDGLNGRGIVVANASFITVRGNRTELTLSFPILIAPLLEGPGSISRRGPIELVPADVTSSTFCNNNLNGIIDDPNGFSVGENGLVTNTVYPGGVAPLNGGCVAPTLVFVPTDPTPPMVFEEGPRPDTVSFYLSRPPTAPVTVNVVTDADTVPITTSVTFTPANWNVYQWVAVNAVDDLFVEGTHISTVTYTFTSADPVWNAAAPVPTPWIVIDNDNGLVAINFTSCNNYDYDSAFHFLSMLCIGESGPNGAYTVVLTQAPATDVVVDLYPPDPQWYTSDGPLRFTPLNWMVPQTIRVFATDDIFREGTPHYGVVRHRTFSDTLMWNNVAVPDVLLSITDNDGPNAALFTAPGANSCLSTTSVTLMGGGENGATIEVYENNVLLGTAVVIGGVWTLGPLTFSEGQHVLTTVQIGIDGLRSPHRGGLTFTVDTIAPAAPVITSPADGATVVGSPTVVTGTSEPFARIVLQRSGIPVAFGNADVNGNWTIRVPLSAGAAALTAIAIDCAANASPPSATVTITVANPTQPIIITPLEGSFVRSPVLVTGTASAGTYVRLLEGGVTIRNNIGVSGAGFWSTTLPFSAGPHTITAVAYAGPTTSIESDLRSFTVDNSPPTVDLDMPPLEFLAQIATPLDAPLTVTGSAKDNNGVVSITLTYTDILTGDVVTTLAAVCTGCPGANVTFSDQPELAPGVYRVVARATDVAGNVSGVKSILLVNATLA